MKDSPTQMSNDQVEDEEVEDEDDDNEEFRAQLWESNDVKCCGVLVPNKTVQFFKLTALFLGFLFVGGGMFHWIEHPNEEIILNELKKDFMFHQEQIIEKLHNHTSTGDILDTWKFYESLQENQIGFNTDIVYKNKWNFYEATIFSFTIITTIGYGTFSPQTQWGQIFLMLYGLIGIPLAGVSLGFIAERVLYVFTLFSQLGKDKAAAAFAEFDADGSGELDEEEFFEALKVLHIELNDKEFKKLWKEVDKDGGGEIDLEEFRIAVKTLDADLTGAIGKKNELIIIIIGILFWLVVGVFVYKYTEEDWTYMRTIYFLFVSLTTIGLGDVVPGDPYGEGFLIVYAMIGLGLVAVLITLLREHIKEWEAKRSEIIRAKKIKSKKRKTLQKLDFFSSMNREQIEKLIDKMDTISYFPKSQIMKEGKLIELYYVLWNGSVNITSDDGTINEVIKSPSLLMESIITDDLNSHMAYASIHADDTVEILSFSRDDYKSSLIIDKKGDKEDDDKSIEIGIITSSDMYEENSFPDSFDHLPEPEQFIIDFINEWKKK